MDGVFSELRYFKELANHKSITHAAKVLGITQPSLSLAIKRLEAIVDTDLLIRTKKGVELTRAGHELLFRSNKLIDYWEDVKSISNKSMTEVQGKIRFGCHSSVGLFTLKYFLPGFIKKYPMINFDIEHELSSTINQRIIELKLDLGIVVNPVRHPDLIITKIFTDEVFLWVKDKNVKLNTLICDKNLDQSQKIMKQLKKKNIQFDKIITCSNLENITALVETGLGVGIIPNRVVKESKRKLSRLIETPVSKDEFAVVYRVEQKNVKAISELVKYIQKVFS